MTTPLPGRAKMVWRLLQWCFLVVGVGILTLLFFAPQLGIQALWNGLIPVAPLLIVLLPGLWRNVCPLAFSAILPHRLKISRQKRLSKSQQGKLLLAGVLLLYLLLPWRHLLLNHNGAATGVLLLLLGAAAFYMGSQYQWKSGWCSGMCPVHPVERFYGPRPAASVANAQCAACHNCVVPCPDSTPYFQVQGEGNTPHQKLAATLMIGGFPGYIWGWFHVPDYYGTNGFNHILSAYVWPLAGMSLTLAIYIFLRKKNVLDNSLLTRLFATAAVSCYYWYRLPELIGFGNFHGDGMLVDLSRQLPPAVPLVLQATALLFFSWWLIFKAHRPHSWNIRPPFANNRNNRAGTIG